MTDDGTSHFTRQSRGEIRTFSPAGAERFAEELRKQGMDAEVRPGAGPALRQVWARPRAVSAEESRLGLAGSQATTRIETPPADGTDQEGQSMPEADFPPTIAEGDRVGRVETPAARAPADRQPSVWKLLWPSSLLAIGALCAGSLSIIGYMEWIARAQFDAHAFVGWILFVAGGGAAVGVAIVSVGRILPRSAIPAATLVIVGLFVFSFFVWPTPFLYHSLESRHAGILRVNRVTGEVLYIPVSERRR